MARTCFDMDQDMDQQVWQPDAPLCTTSGRTCLLPHGLLLMRTSDETHAGFREGLTCATAVAAAWGLVAAALAIAASM